MEKQAVLEKLRAHEPELRAAGIVHLRLFGSVARGQQTAESDVDLLADLHPEKKLSLLGLVHLHHQVEDMLGFKVDFSVADHLRPQIRERVLKEAVHAF
jgi:predicted nucleotidyltransferase